MSILKLIVAILLLSTVQTEEHDLTDKLVNVTVELKDDIVETGNNWVTSVKSHLANINGSVYLNKTKTFINNASDLVEAKVVKWWPSVKKVGLSQGSPMD